MLETSPEWKWNSISSSLVVADLLHGGETFHMPPINRLSTTQINLKNLKEKKGVSSESILPLCNASRSTVIDLLVTPNHYLLLKFEINILGHTESLSHHQLQIHCPRTSPCSTHPSKTGQVPQANIHT